eukprot:Gregarina_sp_Pseudo_9__131@NODE_108_length_4228_cov_56_330389_g100_i0_p2_GENE_NODE_108_length_4228_cov_56_330389_g100_i0NODE_108_length_4228_cov_56_330389_g100_i0_p2_ORF_typecomplete_len638_score109_45Pyr_redox_2/PF07992_14/3_7e10NAD_binding_9/PF13454_6/0_13NAD_binding_9/PF13454_6/5_3e03NAD_binding_9/PF13454_6/5_9e03FMOlike/PF00743_19/2_7FMOlike/PF00743_19/50NAD_binding_8/PF13450_6/0_34Pyr_redox_3/PF13738_6/1e02Pyr_redox_3/PF13738_6/7_7Shikimate_DH/PF01488_20/33Shikimate_DH/PF01488_20/88Shikimat
MAGRMLPGFRKRLFPPTSHPFFAGVARAISSSSPSNPQPQYRLAICGAGAAGLSTLKALRKKWLDRNLDARLHADIFEASLVPLGLIRLGVAPDHLAIKNIGDNLIETIDSWKNDSDRRFTFSFFGGVEVGRAVSLLALRTCYDSVVLTTGSYAPGDTSSPALDIENEYSPGVISSRELVAFYNGQSLHAPEHLYKIYKQVPGVMEELGQWVMDPALLDYSLARSYSLTSVGQDRIPRTTKYQMGSFLDWKRKDLTKVVVIGQGNVSTDIARMLMICPESLSGQHMSSSAKDALIRLYKRYIHEIILVGRRGALQASWDTATLREFANLASDVKVLVNPSELVDSLAHPVAMRAVKRDRAAKRMIDFLEECASNYELEKAAEERGENLNRRITLRFLNSPVAIRCDPDHTGSVNGIEIQRNQLDINSKSKDASELEAIENVNHDVELIDKVRLVVKSIGYGCAGKYNRSRWRTVDTNHKPCKTFVFPRPWKDSIGFKVEDAEENKKASIFGAGWFQSAGRGSLGNTMASGPRVAEQVLNDILAREPTGRLSAARRLTLTLTVPEVGVPVSWEEAYQMLDHEKQTGRKIVEWQNGVDFVNRTRAREGPRGLNWLRDLANNPEALAAIDPHLVNHFHNH